mmetsp:Transcript_27512/g.70028  ORF Transcript_27512/g.70028 Transcript_27512/m.70028 type:complete len:318 (-) Transcript_27512:443-1396(-)
MLKNPEQHPIQPSVTCAPSSLHSHQLCTGSWCTRPGENPRACSAHHPLLQPSPLHHATTPAATHTMRTADLPFSRSASQPAASEGVHDAVGDARLLVLRHALGDPHDVADLLLAQLHVRVEHAVVELLLVREHAPPHLLLVQQLVQHLALAKAQLVKDGGVRGHLLHGSADLVEVLRHGQLVVAVRVQQAKVGVELLAVVARQLRAYAVERDVERAAVGLKGQQVAHDLGGGAAQALAELRKVVQVRLVQRVAHDLDVHLVQVLVAQVLAEVGRQRRVHQHQAVQLAHVLRHRQRGDRVKHAQRVALVQQLLHIALM